MVAEHKKREYLGPGILKPFVRFAELETAGGILLIVSTVAAMVWANSPWAASYFDLWHVHISLGFGDYTFDKTLHHWINDGLMSVFFFVVGLEIKREMLVGELSSPKQAALPIAAAIGGMLVPAGIYLLFNAGGPGAAGWGIPMATDIAFAIGILTLIGSRVPLALKVFLTALAIVDDIGAVVVIAVFYTTNLSLGLFGLSLGFIAGMYVLNRLDFRSPILYFIVGACAWLALLESGVHATVAGVLGALMIPSQIKIDPKEYVEKSRAIIGDFEKATEARSNGGLLNGEQQGLLAMLHQRSMLAESPMQRLEYVLHPWVIYAVMPIFAFANAGVALGGAMVEALTHPISLGIIAGLVVGKQIGITAFALLAAKAGVALLPEKTSKRDVYAVSWLGGIGFTMSLFIANLAFAESPVLLDVAKVGILSASLIAGAVGWVLMRKRYAGAAAADQQA